MPRDEGIDIAGNVQNAAVVVGDHNIVSVRVEIHQTQPFSDEGLTVAPGPNPYRGLLAFQPQDSDVFYGRSEATERLVDAFHRLHEPQAAKPRLLAVLGASGSGKSSLVFAGLLPALERRLPQGVRGLRVVVMTPGADPLENLARAVRSISGAEASLHGEQLAAKRAEFLDARARGETLTSAAAALPDAMTKPLVLVVDQFEEVFTLCGSTDERDVFIRNLLNAAAVESSRTAVVITLRIDFFGATEAHPALAAAISGRERQMLVRAMNDEELREAIAAPARRAGRPLDPSTVALLGEGTRGREGALPLMQFALTCIWDGMARGAEPGTTLAKIGGVGGALAVRAQEIYDRLAPEQQALARRIFVALVQLGDGVAQDARRRVAVADLVAEGDDVATVRAVINEFARPEARLITLSRGERALETAEVTHEALFRYWRALAGWLDRDREDIQLTRRVQAGAEHWNRANRAEGLLWRPPDLDLLIRLRERRGSELTVLQQAFCAASESFEQDRRRAQLEEQRRVKRQARNRAFVAIGSAAAAIGMALVAAFAFRAEKRANAVAEAARNFSIFSAGSQPSDPTIRGVILREVRDPTPAGWGAVAMAASLPSLSADILIGHKNMVGSVAFSPDGTRVITSSNDGTARLWNLDGNRRPIVLQGVHGPTVTVVTSGVFSPDGHRILTNCEDTVQLWNADGTGKFVEFDGHHGTFSPDGSKIFTVNYRSVARIWSADDTHPPITLDGYHDIACAAFSPDSRRIVLGSQNTAVVLSTDGNGPGIVLRGHSGAVRCVAFSPDNKRVATGSVDHTVRVWNADGSGPPVVLMAHDGPVASVAFSPDGKRLLTSSTDTTPRVWDLDGGNEPIDLESPATVFAVAFSPDGSKVLTGSMDGTARIWNADGVGDPVELTGHAAPVISVAFSPNGKTVLTGSMDNTVRVWKLSDTMQPVALEPRHGSERGASDVKVSPDGSKILVGCEAGARLWNSSGTQPPVELTGDQVTSVAFSPDSAQAVLGTPHGAHVINLNNVGNPITLEGDRFICAVAFSSDGKNVFMGSTNGARVWNASTKKMIKLQGHTRWDACTMAFNQDGKKLVIGSSDTIARVWNTDGIGEPVELRGHTGPIRAVAFSADGGTVLTGSDDRTARIWRADGTGQPIELKGHSESIQSVAFSPDGTKVLTGSSDHTAGVWNADGSGQPIEFDGNPEGSPPVAFSPDGKRILMGSPERHAYLWNADGSGPPSMLVGQAGPIWSFSFGPDSTMVVTGSKGCSANLWTLDFRTTLWRKTSFCLPPARRKILLGEPEELANAHYRDCRVLAHTCENNVDACRQAVASAYGSGR